MVMRSALRARATAVTKLEAIRLSPDARDSISKKERRARTRLQGPGRRSARRTFLDARSNRLLAKRRHEIATPHWRALPGHAKILVRSPTGSRRRSLRHCG